MANQKRKRLTQREKAENAAIKKMLQGDGVIPPDKLPLNRRKFAREVIAEYEALGGDALLYLHRAISCMVGPEMSHYSAEEVGVLKVLKIAVETKKFMEALEAEGRSQYKVGEYIDKVVFPIRKL